MDGAPLVTHKALSRTSRGGMGDMTQPHSLTCQGIQLPFSLRFPAGVQYAALAGLPPKGRIGWGMLNECQNDHRCNEGRHPRPLSVIMPSH